MYRVSHRSPPEELIRRTLHAAVGFGLGSGAAGNRDDLHIRFENAPPMENSTELYCMDQAGKKLSTSP